MADAGAGGDAPANIDAEVLQPAENPAEEISQLPAGEPSAMSTEPNVEKPAEVSEEPVQPSSTDEVDAQPNPEAPQAPFEPEPMDTGEAPKGADDGVVDVSGILKDIDDFNRSADPTPPSEPLDGDRREQRNDADMDVTSPPTGIKSHEEAMDTVETPSKSVPNQGGEDDGPDTSQAIAALKSLESYDDVDSRESNEPEQFSEDIVDEEKTGEKAKESGSEENTKEVEREDDKATEEDATETQGHNNEKEPDTKSHSSEEDKNKKDDESELKDTPELESKAATENADESKVSEQSSALDGNDTSDAITEDNSEVKSKTGNEPTTTEGKAKKEVKTEGKPKSKGKGPQTCIVCKKVGKCKYNIVRNGDIKHLCDDNCFKVFRANPTSFLRSQAAGQDTNKTSQSNGSVAADDDVEVVGTSKTGPRTKTRSATGTSNPCSVCGKVAVTKHEINYAGKVHKLCGDPCFNAFRYANKLSMNNCENCSASIPSEGAASQSIQYEGQVKKFCTMICLNTFKSKNSKNVQCVWCGTKKSNFDMVERVEGPNKFALFCTLNCLSLYRVNMQATSNQNVMCDHCRKAAPAQYHLTMSDASVRNFCSYGCVMSFQGQFSQPSGSPGTRQQGSGTRQSSRQANKDKAQTPGGIQISSVRSLAPQTGKRAPIMNSVGTDTVIVQPPPPKDVRNKSLLCKPFTQTKATSCRPHTQTKETQTEGDPRKVIVPVPIPFYIPVPTAMYSVPQPYPLPIPVPIPVPYFIPTTKKSADSILKHIKEIQERMPADPFEAELLMMAEAVAVAEKGSDDSSDESDTEAKPGEDGYGQQGAVQSGELGEDMLQMALRMAQEMPDETLDLEQSLHPATINPENVQPVQPVEFGTIAADSDVLTALPRSQARKRRGGSANSNRGKSRSKRPKHEEQNQAEAPAAPVINQPPPDANMVLKYTYGVNAWKHWVVNKNQQMQQGRTVKLRLFKTDILQCTADELNYSLCLFVKEVRKPNGDEYAPDSIYYLCLGIQQYLFENSRIDNIFTDIYFEKFTECLNEVLQNYEVRLNTAGLIVCRIEEEHLWESKQLGAHSPHVLLNTLIYFNTKYFMLKTPEEHLRLSFSHIMKHWKKTNMPGTKTPGRSVYLRYYAPVPNAKDAQKRKREELPVFEQAENVENPLRCPVKLYEFYLSKAPESIKNRNDVFYLIPERSCVPDSPVWYSTGNLGIEAMTKMLNRTRVVREIQEAHLHHQPLYGIH